MEFMNEQFVFIGCYFMFLFTDFVDSDVRYDIGWGISLFICLVIAINFTIMMVKAFIETKRSF
jgi:hypothetical protein